MVDLSDLELHVVLEFFLGQRYLLEKQLLYWTFEQERKIDRTNLTLSLMHLFHNGVVEGS